CAVSGTHFTLFGSFSTAAAIARQMSTSSPVQLPWLSACENPASPVFTPQTSCPRALTASSVLPAWAGMAATSAVATSIASFFIVVLLWVQPPILRLQAQDPCRFLALRIADLAHHAGEIDVLLFAHEQARERRVGRQRPGLVGRPDFVAIVGGEDLRREPAEEVAQVHDVALEHRARVVVAGGVHGLGQVDDHGTVGRGEDVELAQV